MSKDFKKDLKTEQKLFGKSLKKVLNMSAIIALLAVIVAIIDVNNQLFTLPGTTQSIQSSIASIPGDPLVVSVMFFFLLFLIIELFLVLMWANIMKFIIPLVHHLRIWKLARKEARKVLK